jgi:hypothetical protein
VKRREANTKKRKKDDKLVDDLNVQGQKAAEDAAKERDDNAKADDKELQKGINLARKAGEAAKRFKRPELIPKGLDLNHLELIPMDQQGNFDPAAAEKAMGRNDRSLTKNPLEDEGVMQKLAENQGQLTVSQRQTFQKIRQMLDNIGAGIQADRSQANNGFQ